MSADKLAAVACVTLSFCCLAAPEPAAGSGDAPTDAPTLAGLVGWFDSRDVSSLFLDSGGTQPATREGDPIALWKSRVGTAALAQPDPALRPLRASDSPGGQEALEFPKRKAWLGMPDLAPVLAADDWTLFVVAALDASSNGGDHFFQVRADRHLRGFKVKNRCRRCVHFDWNDDEEMHTEHTLDDGWNLIDGVSAERSVTVWTNGELEGTLGAYSRLGSDELAHGIITLGANTEKKWAAPRPLMNGFIGEVLLYDRALRESELKATREYLMERWKIERR